jgi:hypothetical protein
VRVKVLAAAVVAIAAAVVVTLLIVPNQRSGTLESSTDPSRRIAFTITTQRAGEQVVHTATLSCLGVVAGTGYLAGTQASSSACTTALTSKGATEVLEAIGGKKLRCARLIEGWESSELVATTSGRAKIVGTYPGKKRVKVELDTSRGRCDEAMWGLVEPMLTPMSEPRHVDVEQSTA